MPENVRMTSSSHSQREVLQTISSSGKRNNCDRPSMHVIAARCSMCCSDISTIDSREHVLCRFCQYSSLCPTCRKHFEGLPAFIFKKYKEDKGLDNDLCNACVVSTLPTDFVDDDVQTSSVSTRTTRATKAGGGSGVRQPSPPLTRCNGREIPGPSAAATSNTGLESLAEGVETSTNSRNNPPMEETNKGSWGGFLKRVASDRGGVVAIALGTVFVAGLVVGICIRRKR